MRNRIKEKLHQGFTILPNEVFAGTLTPKAVGIFAYLCSKDDNWNFNSKEIASHFNVGLTQVQTALKELESEKLLMRCQINNHGKFGVIDYILYPQEDDYENATEGKDGIFYVNAKPVNAFPVNAKPNNIIIKNINKKETNKKELINTSCKPEDEVEVNSSKITKNDFEKFWKLYPKKSDKGKALTSWLKLSNKKDRPTYKEIKIAIIKQSQTERWQKGFIPLPATWLNQSRWLDDPKEMVSYNTSAQPSNKLRTKSRTNYQTNSVEND